MIINTGDTSEDTQLGNWISVAREYGEDRTGHAFAPQTIDKYLDCFPSDDYIDWSPNPLTSITSIKYKDYLGVETILTVTTQYIVDTDSFYSKIFLPYGVSWPTFTAYPYNPVTIRGVCGYTTLPKQFKQAMLMHIGFLYKYRDCEIPEENMRTVNALYRMRGNINL